MRKLAAETVGTFFLVLAVCLAVGGGLGAFAPIAIGLTLAVMVYACGHISGGHLNPAVSTGVLLRGRMQPNEAALYMAAQIAGGIVAAVVALAMRGGGVEPAPIAAGSGIAAEALGAFALVWVVLNVATAKGTNGNSFYGFAIGLTVTACAYTLGGFSGGAFNPAVAIGGAVFGVFRWNEIWIHILGSCLGGAAAAVAFRGLNPDDRCAARRLAS